MSRLTQAIAGGALAVAVIAGGAASAAPTSSGGVSPKIAVPAPGPFPPGGSMSGCYRIDQRIYGPYRMSFCLTGGGRGSYQVTGGGLDCRAGLTASPRGPLGVGIQLKYARCGKGTAWTADTLSCRVDAVMFPPRPFRPNMAVPNIAVPDRKGDLRCSYNPAVRGYPSIQVHAARTR